jgi:hypothetical protein
MMQFNQAIYVFEYKQYVVEVSNSSPALTSPSASADAVTLHLANDVLSRL